MDTDAVDASRPPQAGAAFLLAQLGAHAAELFAQRIVRLDLTPAQAGLLRLLAQTPGRSQRELADVLGMPPSRFVPFADDLERRGLLERRKNPGDRRLHALFLTEDGAELLSRLRVEAAAHEKQMCAALAPSEHQELTGLLRRLAQQQGLSPGIHPGYRSMRTSSTSTAGRPAPDQSTA
ncbi:MarR family winged helix-turn-helix transcriptional regulator [Saccharopolyspora shandongensis]|uniref:MarR family winged helix-turn-helix transcriptional regulator n=1 Tax=Saccharopolyspora shandongensis TaxID=418495 RepID=UPI0033F7406A